VNMFHGYHNEAEARDDSGANISKRRRWSSRNRRVTPRSQVSSI
jgi:hypothetical protein